jgi:hypothetical protein
MPQNTTRGYTYPLYTDPHDFPADMSNLALDIDADVQSIINEQTDSLDQPSARVSASAALAIASNTDVTLTWATEEFDVGGMFVIGSPTIFTIAEAGIYEIHASCLWAPNTDSTTSGCGLRIQSSVGGTLARHEQRRGVNATPDSQLTESHVMTVANLAVATTISVIARHNLPSSNNITFREFTITKISENA